MDRLLPPRLANIPRIPLANLPTPLMPLARLSADLGGPQIWIKRDDLTGLATGGNKTRKLEFLIADAIERGADSVITAGGPQSNHCRQTAAAAAHRGLDCHLVLGGGRPEISRGNLLLDELLAATIHWTDKKNRNDHMQSLAERLTATGHHPYVIPIGGSNGTGAVGYVAAMFELMEQLATAGQSIDHILFATSSGGTQAGLVLGAALAGFSGTITAVSIDQLPDGEDPEIRFCEFVASVANDAAELLGVEHRVSASDIGLEYGYLGDGYGVVGDLERNAVKRLARTEGILVGPVYTARAVGGLIDLVERGTFESGQNVLFWHTGDETALHGYAEAFQ